MSALHLTGLLSALVPTVRALPLDFSIEPDSFARPVLAIRTSRSALIARTASTLKIFESMERVLDFSNRTFAFSITGLESTLSVVRYDVGEELDWHTDTGGDSTAAVVRKISFTVQLSEPEDYDGGELQFCACADDPFAKAVGTAVVFPSFMAHRVTAVTRGTRLALVGFAVGPQFR